MLDCQAIAKIPNTYNALVRFGCDRSYLCCAKGNYDNSADQLCGQLIAKVMMRLARSALFALLLACPASLAHEKELFLRQADETSIVRIKADPDLARDKIVVIAGYVTIDDYYSDAHPNQERTHQSVRFVEFLEPTGDELEAAHLYLARDVFKRPMESIRDAAAKKKCRIARVEVMLLDDEWDMLEVLDIQLYDKVAKRWEPWLVRTAKEAAAKQRR